MNNYIKYLSIIILIILILYFYYYNNFKNTNIEHFSSSEIFDYSTWKYDILLNKKGNVSYIYGYPQLNLDNTSILSYLHQNKNQYGENISYSGDITAIDITQKGYYLKNGKDLYVPTINSAYNNYIKTVNLCNEFVIEYKLNTKIIKENDVYYNNDRLGLDPSNPSYPEYGSAHIDLNNFLTDISIFLINNYKCTTFNNYKVWKPVPYGLKWKKVSKVDFDNDDDVGRILNYHDYKALSSGTAVPFKDGFYGSENPEPSDVLYSRVYKECKGWGINKHRTYSIADKDDTNVYIQPNTKTAPIYIVAEDIKNRILKHTTSSENTYNFEKGDWDYYNITDLRYNDYIYVSKLEPGNRETDEYWKPIIDFGPNPHGIGTITDSNNITKIWRKALSEFNKINKDNEGWALEVESVKQEEFTSLELSKENLDYFINNMGIKNDKSIYEYYFQNSNGVIYVPKLIPDLHNGYLTLKGMKDNDLFDEYSALSIGQYAWYTSSYKGVEREKVEIIDIFLYGGIKKYKIKNNKNEELEIEKNDFNLISELEYKYYEFVENKKSLKALFSTDTVIGTSSISSCKVGADNCNICYTKDDIDDELKKLEELTFIIPDIADEYKYKYAILDKVITKHVTNMPANENFKVDDYIMNTDDKYGTIISVNNNKFDIMYDGETELTRDVEKSDIEIVYKITVKDNDGQDYHFGIIDDEQPRQFSYIKIASECNVFKPEEHLDISTNTVQYNDKTWYDLKGEYIGKIQDDDNFNVGYLEWENVGPNLPVSMNYTVNGYSNVIGKQIIINSETIRQNFQNTAASIGDKMILNAEDIQYLNPTDNKNYFNYISVNNNYYRPVDCTFEKWIAFELQGEKEVIRNLYKKSQINCCRPTTISQEDKITYSKTTDPNSLSADNVCISKIIKDDLINKVKNEKSKECLISKTDLENLPAGEKFISINTSDRYDRYSATQTSQTFKENDYIINSDNKYGTIISVNDNKFDIMYDGETELTQDVEKSDIEISNAKTYLNPTIQNWEGSSLSGYFDSSTPGYGLIGEDISQYQEKSFNSDLKNKIDDFDTSDLESLTPPYTKSSALSSALGEEFNFKFIDDHIDSQNPQCRIKNIYTYSDQNDQNLFTYTWVDEESNDEVTRSWGKTGKTVISVSGEDTVNRPDITGLSSAKFADTYIYTNQDLYYEDDTLCNDAVTLDSNKKCLHSWVGENIYSNVDDDSDSCAVDQNVWDEWITIGRERNNIIPLSVCKDVQCTQETSEMWVNQDMYLQTNSLECGVDLTPALTTQNVSTIPIDYNEDEGITLSAFYKEGADGDDRYFGNSQDYKVISSTDLMCPFPLESDLTTDWCNDHDQSTQDYNKCCGPNARYTNTPTLGWRGEWIQEFDDTEHLKRFKENNWWPNVCAYRNSDNLKVHFGDGADELPERHCISNGINNKCYKDDGTLLQDNELYNFGISIEDESSPYVDVTNCNIAEIYTYMAPIIKLKKVTLSTAPQDLNLYENQYLTNVINSLIDKDKGSLLGYITLTPVKELIKYNEELEDVDEYNIIDKEKLNKLIHISELEGLYTAEGINDILKTIAIDHVDKIYYDSPNNLHNDLCKMLNDYSIHIGLDYTYLKDFYDNYWKIVLDVEKWIKLLNDIYISKNSMFDISSHQYIKNKNDSNVYEFWQPIKPYKIITPKNRFFEDIYWGFVSTDPVQNTNTAQWELNSPEDAPTYRKNAIGIPEKNNYKNRKIGGCIVSKNDLLNVDGTPKIHISDTSGTLNQGDHKAWWPRSVEYDPIDDYIKYENCAKKTKTDQFTTRDDTLIRESHKNKTYTKEGPWQTDGETNREWWHPRYKDEDTDLKIYTNPDNCNNPEDCTYAETISIATDDFEANDNTYLTRANELGNNFADNGCFIKKCETLLDEDQCNNKYNCLWDSGSCHYNKTLIQIPHNLPDVNEYDFLFNDDNPEWYSDKYLAIETNGGIQRYIATNPPNTFQQELHGLEIKKISTDYNLDDNTYFVKDDTLNDYWPGFDVNLDPISSVRNNNDKLDTTNTGDDSLHTLDQNRFIYRPDGEYNDEMRNYCAVSRKDKKYNKYYLDNNDVKGFDSDTGLDDKIKDHPPHIIVDSANKEISWCSSDQSTCPALPPDTGTFLTQNSVKDLCDYGLYKYNTYDDVSSYMYDDSQGTSITNYDNYYTPMNTNNPDIYNSHTDPVTIKNIFAELKTSKNNGECKVNPENNEFRICTDNTVKLDDAVCDGDQEAAHYGRIMDSDENPLLYTNKQSHNYAVYKYNKIINQFGNVDIGNDNPFCDETGNKKSFDSFKRGISDHKICSHGQTKYDSWNFNKIIEQEPVGGIEEVNCLSSDTAQEDEKWYNPYSDYHGWSVIE